MSHIDALYEAAQKAMLDMLGCDSGMTAVWCRVHGDCICPHPWDDGEHAMEEDPNCPLHAARSDHADDDAVRGRGRAALARMVEEHPQTVMVLVEVYRAAQTLDKARLAMIEAQRDRALAEKEHFDQLRACFADLNVASEALHAAIDRFHESLFGVPREGQGALNDLTFELGEGGTQRVQGRTQVGE